MPLKNIDNANPKLVEYWLNIADTGMVQELFANKQIAANIRSQMGTLRNLARKQSPSLWEMTEMFTLQTIPWNNGMFAIQGLRPIKVTDIPQLSVPPVNVGVTHHNPLVLSPTGIPMPMPEVLAPGVPVGITAPSETEEERKARESREFHARSEQTVRNVIRTLNPSGKLRTDE